MSRCGMCFGFKTVTMATDLFGERFHSRLLYNSRKSELFQRWSCVLKTARHEHVVAVCVFQTARYEHVVVVCILDSAV